MYTRLRSKHILPLIFVISLGLVLRLINLNVPLWGDEVDSWAWADKSTIITTWIFASHDTSPPLYYVVLHVAMSLFGADPVGLRLASVIFSVFCIPLAYWGVYQATSSLKQSTIAAFLVAFSSMLINYGQEARPYSLLTFLSLLSVCLIVRYMNQPQRWIIIVYVLLLVAMIYTHLYSYFLIAAELLCFLFYKHWNMLVIGTLTVIFCFIMLGIKLTSQPFNFGASGDNITWQAVHSLVTSLNAGTIGLQNIPKIPQGATLRFPNNFINNVVPVVAKVFTVLIILIIFKFYNQKNTKQRQLCTILGVCIIVPLMLGFLAGSPLSPRPQWLLRGLIFIWPLYYILIVIILSGSRLKSYLLGVFLMLNVFSLYPYYTTYQRFSDKEIFDTLNQQLTNQDLIVVDPWYMHNVVNYYTDNVSMIGYSPRLKWIDIEMIQNSDVYNIYQKETIDPVVGNIYVYYRRNSIQWEEYFPNNEIFVFSDSRKSWINYRTLIK